VLFHHLQCNLIASQDSNSSRCCRAAPRLQGGQDIGAIRVTVHTVANPLSVADRPINNTHNTVDYILLSLLKSHVVGLSVGCWITSLSCDVTASALGVSQTQQRARELPGKQLPRFQNYVHPITKLQQLLVDGGCGRWFSVCGRRRDQRHRRRGGLMGG
jgi:hypothetical protein